MIQRQQSLWLLLCAICAFLSFEFPFFSGAQQIGTTGGKAVFLNAGSSLFLILLTGASLLLSLITIFMFKDRKLQMKLCVVGITLSILILVIYFNEMSKLSGSISLAAIFVFAIPVGYIMALIRIWKDEKLVKSLDKLR